MDPIPPDRPPDPRPPRVVVVASDDEMEDVTGVKQVPSLKRVKQAEITTPAKKTIKSKEAAVASIQSVYTHPEMSILGIREYDVTDSGPFIVHVSRVDSDPASGTTFRPIKFGQFLFTNKIDDICQDGIKKVGRNKIAVIFKSAAGANKFIDSSVLKANKYEATIPTYNVTRMGLVRGVPVDWSLDEFVESLQASGPIRIVKARRLNRKVKNEDSVSWEPTQTVVLTFRGQQLPSRVFSYYSSLVVETYQFPTIQCHNCCRFGHIKSQCRSTARCYRCAQPHCGEECSVSEQESSCLFCRGNHFSTSRSCPEQDTKVYQISNV